VAVDGSAGGTYNLCMSCVSDFVTTFTSTFTIDIICNYGTIQLLDIGIGPVGGLPIDLNF